MMGKNATLILILLGGFILFGGGILVGTFFDRQSTESLTSRNKAENEFETDSELHKIGAKLTSPLLLCDTSSHIETSEFNVFEQKLNTEVKQLVAQKKVDHVAIYFRKLLDGAWFGINEKDIFTPASLLKVPVMISIFKQAEAKPEILDSLLRYEKVYFLDKPHYEVKTKLELGKEYTVLDLITRMVKYSDNESMFLLREKFDSTVIDSIYKDLKMIPPDDSVSNDFMTIRSYASFFRILFNASYLTPVMSEKALDILSSIDFKEGITKELPPDIVVAHKFGERTYTDDNTNQLHDCGIVYYPNDPYLLCVMSKGKDFDSLSSVLSQLSKSVWEEMKLRAIK